MRYDALVSEQNNNLLNFIAATVETMRDQMATKADLAGLKEQMATKAELAVVKDELAVVRNEMATKSDLATVKTDLATVKTDLAIVKTGLARLEERVETNFTAVRGDFEQVHLRLDAIDGALSGRIGSVETEVSRLRSVVYLLVKDKPDMLRLLGQSGLHEKRPQS
jgi:hypothetical protein